MTTEILDDQSKTPALDDQSQAAITNFLEKLVGENKKYKSVDDLAKGKVHADEFIETLKREKQEALDKAAKAEAELAKRQTAEEILEKLKADTGKAAPTNATFDPNNLTELVSSILKETNQTEKAKANFNVVSGELAKLHGDKGQEVFKAKARELGFSETTLATIAQENPDKALELLGLKKTITPSAPRSSVNTPAVPPTDSQDRRTYWNKLRRENPRAYNDPKQVAQRHKEYEEGLIPLEIKHY